VCLFANGGYLMALSFVPFGDIDCILTGVEHPLPWRVGMTALGGVSYVTALFRAAHALDEFLGLVDRRARAAKLLVTSHLVRSTSLILSTLLGNEGVNLTLVSVAPATLGGTFGVLYTTFLVGGPKPSTDLRVRFREAAGHAPTSGRPPRLRSEQAPLPVPVVRVHAAGLTGRRYRCSWRHGCGR
jgi:hypothetical protein